MVSSSGRAGLKDRKTTTHWPLPLAFATGLCTVGWYDAQMRKTNTIPMDDHGAWQRQAIGVLEAGGILGVPTETVYGLAGDATRADVIAAIYAAKGRPSHNPLIVHVADLAMAERYAVFSATARTLAEAFWPGPLTLVLPLMDRPLKGNARLADAVTAGGDSLAIRCPQGPLGELSKAMERPLAAPSANRSGHVSATSAAHVSDDLGHAVGLILDGGPSRLGVESTIIDLRNAPRILRPGALSSHDIGNVLNIQVPLADGADDARPVAPGQLSSHYAPSVPVRLNVLPGEVDENEAYLGFGVHALEGYENLSPGSDVTEAAARLYAALRDKDGPGISAIAIAPIPEEGLGQALADRLKRAAAPRG